MLVAAKETHKPADCEEVRGGSHLSVLHWLLPFAPPPRVLALLATLSSPSLTWGSGKEGLVSSL